MYIYIYLAVISAAKVPLIHFMYGAHAAVIGHLFLTCSLLSLTYCFRLFWVRLNDLQVLHVLSFLQVKRFEFSSIYYPVLAMPFKRHMS